jgi:hypothetical protein
MPIGLLGAGPLLDAYGVGPVFMGTAAIQTIAMAGLALAAVRARHEGATPALERAA